MKLKKPKPLPGNNKPKKELAFSMQIDVFTDHTSGIKFDRDGVVLVSAREMLARYVQIFTDQIIKHDLRQEQNKVQIVGPQGVPFNMKLRQ